MAASDPIPVSAEPARSRPRLPHWGWFLLATVVLSVGCVGLSVWWPYHREQQVIHEIESLGGYAFKTVGPLWLRNLVGDDRIQEIKFFERVNIVYLDDKAITDADLAHLNGLTHPYGLFLDDSAVTDAGLSS